MTTFFKVILLTQLHETSYLTKFSVSLRIAQKIQQMNAINLETNPLISGANGMQ